MEEIPQINESADWHWQLAFTYIRLPKVALESEPTQCAHMYLNPSFDGAGRRVERDPDTLEAFKVVKLGILPIEPESGFELILEEVVIKEVFTESRNDE